MQGDPEVIEFLNEQLTGELTAINQYFLHAKMQENFGWPKLAKYTRSESFDEMKHAEMLTDRILLLEGLPNYQRLFHVRVGQTVTEMFQADKQVEVEAIDRLRRGIEVMHAKGDFTSRHERAISGVKYVEAPAGETRWITSDVGGYLLEWSRRPSVTIRGSLLDRMRRFLPDWTRRRSGAPDRTSAGELARRNSGGVGAIAASRDGSFLVTAGEDLLAWDLSSRNVLATAESYAKRSYVEPTEVPTR